MLPHEKTQVYEMEYEQWGYGESRDAFFFMNQMGDEHGVRYILINDEGVIVSSLLLVTNNPSHRYFNSPTFGFCSVLTNKNYRNLGYAKTLIRACIEENSSEGNGSVFFLYSDISTSFYERLGFRELPDSLQFYKDTICMVHCNDEQFQRIKLLKRQQIPNYFIF